MLSFLQKRNDDMPISLEIILLKVWKAAHNCSVKLYSWQHKITATYDVEKKNYAKRKLVQGDFYVNSC
jgi:hypothetical protein